MDSVLRRALHALTAALALLPQLLVAAPDLALQMNVNPIVPTSGQPVEFTVIVSNVGTTTAGPVVVSDRLPPELTIPAGLAVFPSVGTYDPASGEWAVGSLAPGARATLVIPAVVAVAPQPVCSVNVAEATLSADSNPNNDRAVAAVKANTTDRCVDLMIVSTGWKLTGCEGAYDNAYEFQYFVTVSNAGPDDAASVYLDLAQEPAAVPHLRFVSDGCNDLRCSFATFPAGTSISLKAKSGTIDFGNNKKLVFSTALSGTETDYTTANNQRQDNVIIPKTPSCADEDAYYESGGSVSCFIATAAYGSALEPHVKALRDFRDRYLQRTAVGRAFIRFYYRYSPPVAEVIARHGLFRLLARALLTPMVLVIEFPVQMLAAGAVALGMLVVRHRGLAIAVLRASHKRCPPD
jgi:uncharacterized repeat protein (TIGR01451 family)